MRTPQHQSGEQLHQEKLLDAVGEALKFVRRSIDPSTVNGVKPEPRRRRSMIEAACNELNYRVMRAHYENDDEDDIQATIRLLANRCKFVVPRLAMLLPILACIESQIEAAEEKLP